MHFQQCYGGAGAVLVGSQAGQWLCPFSYTHVDVYKRQGQPIIEAASGPFATALTLASLTAEHPIVLVMPEDAPALRQEYLLRLGAQIRHLSLIHI